MLSEDYLMRLIRLATQALAKILGLKAAGLYTDALYLIDQMLEQVVGLKADLINNVEDDSVIAMLTRDGKLDTDRLLIAAELIKEEADILAAQKQVAESHWRYLRCLNFYLDVVLDGGPTELPTPVEQIDALTAMLDEKDLPVETQFSLYAYYEGAGRYAQAGAALERLLQATHTQEDLLEERREFYQRLASKTDAELGKGGMTRKEVEAALTQIDR